MLGTHDMNGPLYPVRVDELGGEDAYADEVVYPRRPSPTYTSLPTEVHHRDRVDKSLSSIMMHVCNTPAPRHLTGIDTPLLNIPSRAGNHSRLAEYMGHTGDDFRLSSALAAAAPSEPTVSYPPGNIGFERTGVNGMPYECQSSTTYQQFYQDAACTPQQMIGASPLTQPSQSVRSNNPYLSLFSQPPHPFTYTTPTPSMAGLLSSPAQSDYLSPYTPVDNIFRMPAPFKRHKPLSSNIPNAGPCVPNFPSTYPTQMPVTSPFTRQYSDVLLMPKPSRARGFNDLSLVYDSPSEHVSRIPQTMQANLETTVSSSTIAQGAHVTNNSLTYHNDTIAPDQRKEEVHFPAMPFPVAQTSVDRTQIQGSKKPKRSGKDKNWNPCDWCRDHHVKCDIIKDNPSLCVQCNRHSMLSCRRTDRGNRNN